MKRNNLTTALLAGLAGAAGLATTAQAVNLNPDGLGQVLIYPYYTVNAGNQTLVSVVNTTNRVKAVKVRFLEGRNSKEVLDFNLYLSPFDVWAGAVFDEGTQGTGPGNLVTTDTSCTVPRLTGNVPFRNFAYTGPSQDFPSNNTAPPAAVLGSLERTREGHIEMIEMGLLQNGTGAAQLAEEATHNQNGQVTGQVPLNCTALVNAWNPANGVWGASTTGNPQTNIDTPAGGLFGAGALVDTADGTMLAYNAEAIEGFYTNSAAPGALHTNPGSLLPQLTGYNNSGTTATAFIFSNNGAAVISETFPAPPVGNLPDAVSLIFMHNNIYNEFNTESAIGVSSEWVITYPTKRFYVDDNTAPFVASPPFTNPFRDNGSACEEIDISYRNREEAQPSGSDFCTLNPTDPLCAVDFSPLPPPTPGEVIVGPVLCEESNVLSFNQSAVAAGGASRILGGSYARNVNLRASTDPGQNATYSSGWVRIGFDDPATTAGGLPLQDHVLTTPDSSQYFGLPTIGFWAVNVVNTAAQPGLLANYSGAFRHRGSRANSG
jgi:hypothetical protein